MLLNDTYVFCVLYSDIIRAIKPDSGEYDDVAQECNIRGIQKIKLRAALKSLHELPATIIDKEEAIIKMADKLKSIQNAIKLFADTTKSYVIYIIYMIIYTTT